MRIPQKVTLYILLTALFAFGVYKTITAFNNQEIEDDQEDASLNKG